jgi:CRP-like cAMP-binding protein
MASPPVDFRLLAGAGVAARDFKAGDVIFREGDPARGVFNRNSARRLRKANSAL